VLNASRHRKVNQPGGKELRGWTPPPNHGSDWLDACRNPWRPGPTTKLRLKKTCDARGHYRQAAGWDRFSHPRGKALSRGKCENEEGDTRHPPIQRGRGRHQGTQLKGSGGFVAAAHRWGEKKGGVLKSPAKRGARGGNKGYPGSLRKLSIQALKGGGKQRRWLF